MAKSKGIIWFVALAVCFGCFGIAKAGDKVDAKLVAEAKQLFQVVLADEPPARDCELEPTWQRYSIPESLAREHFGLRVHAELSAPMVGPRLTDILDLAADSELVCSDDRARSIESALLTQYATSGDDRIFTFRRTGYTFPVFSDDYLSAALIIFHSSQDRARMPDGVKILPHQATGYVASYKKIEGTWRRTTTVTLFVT